MFQFSIEKIGEFEFKQVVDKTCAQSGKIDITSQTELQVTFATDNVGNERTGFIAYFNQTLGMSRISCKMNQGKTQNNKKTCALSEDSDQTEHPPSLRTVFAFPLMNVWNHSCI